MTGHPSPPSRGRPRTARAAAGTVVLVAALLPLTATGVAAEPSDAPRAGLVAEYLFDQTSGTSVPSSTGDAIGPATVVNGTDELWTGSSLVLTGGAKSGPGSWVRLPEDLLEDRSSATVTIETRLDASMKTSWNFLWNIGSDSTTEYYFASVRDAARTAITASGGGGEANARSGSALDADRWYSLTSVLDGEAGRLTFYVDGEQVGSTATTLTPAAITDQSLSTIGRAPYDDPLYRGEVSTFRVYDRALSPTEVAAVSTADATIHAATHEAAAQAVLDRVSPVTIDEPVTTLPSYGGRVTWTSTDPRLTIGQDGVTVTAEQPAPGTDPISTTLTATATVRGTQATDEVSATVRATPAADEPFGYAMVHFIEDSAGYAEKIYLDVSRGDDPERWDPLNGGEPILASHLGTTGVRDPYLTYNPETGTYYIIATDLRVFGGDRGAGSCVEWCHWSSQGSTKLNVWESPDLITWSGVRQVDVALDVDGTTPAELGMAWAPEATWVEDYYPDGSGAFVLYWSSNVYTDAQHTGPTYSRVLWGATSDFTQETYEYGGVFIDEGGNTIDTTITQHDGTTYRVTKDNSAGRGLYMESTTAPRWWEPSATWSTIQTTIGASWAGGDPGGVEGPAIFKAHGQDRWYLYVDVIPTTGYRPMVTTDLDAGWTVLDSPGFFMAPSTKHGGIIPLTGELYADLRAADATGAVTTDLGSVEVPEGADDDVLRAALPGSAEVTLAYGRGTAEQPVDWDLATVDRTTAGTYPVTGTVRTIGANLNQWVGAGGSTAWDAAGREPYSSTAVVVEAEVVVVDAAAPEVGVAAQTRCVAGSVVLAVRVTNEGEVPVNATVTTDHGARTVGSLEAGRSASVAISTRQPAITAGSVTVTAEADGRTASGTSPYAGADCG
ncbi:Ig-like domain-containing protein [Actinotalea sp. BY-33]|uniref:Ig-like domain-containing protein n=1 Tax=Actinotalea soli TaxID=2819234 RepID=A0A939LPL8_9CELL|nr:LamG-like jellyroll fold domain-containing protein [Actinotalea soli]MBO1752076.1 Ig-like domain-containing protein [Actinotalea soli]